MHILQTVARGMILLAIFCLFLGRTIEKNHEFEQVKQIPEQQMVIVSGMICKKEYKGEDGLYYIKNAVITVNPDTTAVKITGSGSAVTDTDAIVLHRVILRVASTDFRIGQVIEVSCKMRWMDEASNRGGFDERQYYHSLGVDTFLYCDQLPQVLEQKRKCPVRNGLCILREQMRTVYVEMLNEKDAGILSSMVLGDKSLMEDDLKQLYSEAGISHILAVSGLHVSIIGMTLFRFLRKHKQKYPTCCLISGVVLLLFCVMSGMSVSAVRAGIMFLIFLGAQYLGRKYDSLRALLVAAVITLIVNPGYIYNAGFLFSYFAVFGAVAVAPIFAQTTEDRTKELEDKKQQILKQNTEKSGLLPKIWKKQVTYIRQSAILSGSILLTTLPLNAYFFYEIPMYGLLANLVVIPLAGLLMGFGLLGGLLGSLLHLLLGNTALMAGSSFAWIVFIPCHWILRLYEGICQGLKWLPADVWITGRPPIWMLILYYGVLVFLVWIRYNHVRKNVRKTDSIKKAHRNLVFLVVSVSLMITMFTQLPAKQFQISFLDVGQGDGIYINGGDGRQYFVDGGSTSEDELGRYTILPFLKYHRVRQIDVWFVSHADTDHISGLLEALERGYSVKTIVISALAPEDENLMALKQAARKCGTNIVTVENGEYIQGEDYRIICYTPEAGDLDDRNQASLVNLVEYQLEETYRWWHRREVSAESQKNLRILLTGDIGQEQEAWLLEQAGIGDVDVLKAAHHGSRYSNSQIFLETLAPELTIISCAENNLYGHPHAETLERMERVDSRVLLTMEVGEITICP